MLTNLAFSGPNAALCYIYVFSVFCENKKISLVQGAPFENNVPVRIHDLLKQDHGCFT